MGKKTRKKKNKGSASTSSGPNANFNDVDGNPNDDMARNFRKNREEYYGSQATEGIHQMQSMSLPEQKKCIRKKLLQIGTDCAKNDDDPFGDGDQSPIQTEAQADTARLLYAIGGDMNFHLRYNEISAFANAVLLGHTTRVCDEILKHVKCSIASGLPLSRNEDIKQLLERRETSMRVSPLLLIVSMGKSSTVLSTLAALGIADSAKKYHVEVAKILLKYGASPEAKDVLGKTVCHYGAGAFATDMTLEVADMCIRAAQTSYMYGKDAELFGLKTAAMNGKRGVVCGFDTDTGRRSVFLVEEESGKSREVWVKPENIKLVGTQNESSCTIGIPMLADVQDRMGGVCLQEVILRDKVHVAEFLLKKHRASIYVEDMHGYSAMKMAINGRRVSNVCKMVMDAARRGANDDRKAKKQCGICACCKKLLGNGGKKCSGCSNVAYCGRECQRKHWYEGHKDECTRLTGGVKVEPMDMPSGHIRINICHTTHTTKKIKGSYRKPDGVKTNEKFVLKVQVLDDISQIMVYDETRTCDFIIGSQSPGYKEILLETRKEMAWNGRKTFMKASFDNLGNCTVYPVTAGVKSKYTW